MQEQVSEQLHGWEIKLPCCSIRRGVRFFLIAKYKLLELPKLFEALWSY
jgi:hypothetical protein